MTGSTEGRLAGACALVTGGARRIGAELVRALHAEGADVAIHFRNSSAAAAELAAALEATRPGSTALISADLSTAERCEAVVARAGERFGRLDLLVNNASSFYATPVGQIDEARFDDLIGSNLRAPTFVAQAAAPWLEVTGGSIVNIADIHGWRPREGFNVYCCAKAALGMLTQALAVELAPGVRVNAIAPGSILWPEGPTGDDPDVRRAVLEATPLARKGSPADIAAALLYLAADAPFVTGETLRVDGGRGL